MIWSERQYSEDIIIQAMGDYYFGADFEKQAIAAIDKAREETLAAGVSIFYHDATANIEIMEEPSGRKFEIVYIPNAPGKDNYKVVRELSKNAA